MGRTRVRILDRERYWAFFKAYVICYFSLVGLYIVIDAFSNFDEFTKRADGMVEIFQVMGRFYLIHQSQFFDQLCMVIGMMAAIFTVTWMQRNNEQIAILAAGVSTQRAIRPVLVSAVIVNFLAMSNQEIIMPYFAEELAKSHDDDGLRKVNVSTRHDARGNILQGREADRGQKTIMPFSATFPVEIFGSLRHLKGQQGTYIPEDHPTAPLKGGWLVRQAKIKPPLDDKMLRAGSEILSRIDDLRGYPAYVDRQNRPEGQPDSGPTGISQPLEQGDTLSPHSEVAYLASLPPFPLCYNPIMLRTNINIDRKIDLGQGDYFLKSDLTFQAMTRKQTWYYFATTGDLLQALTNSWTAESEQINVAVFVHTRLLRPFLAINLLCMSLPLVLGGFGRNTFINLGFALGNSAVFYGSIFLCQELGSFEIVGPALAAWLPLIGFGTVATWRWGKIRT
jgi:lipopolysaccharide export system permease protein